MRILGRTERRVVAAILVTALIPLVASIVVARTVIARVSATAFQPEFGVHLDRALGVYAELAAAIKQGMRSEAEAIARGDALRQGAFAGDAERLRGELARVIAAQPALVSLRVERCGGELVGAGERGRPVDPAREKTLTVRRPLDRPPGDPGPPREAATAAPAPADGACDGDALILVATFATPSARFDELESAQAFAQAYHALEREHRKEYLDESYGDAFAALLGATIVLAALAGVLVVRPVVDRLARLAAATRPVAEGDLSVRVALEGDDEVADLGRAFDRMLEELEGSRARIEFLRRMGEWQKMARHLAHEIKNPLTPIQLAVEECHRRYAGSDPAYQRLLQTTLEVVEEEVATLRRLVGEFSSFARLPQAELEPVDLAEFLREQGEHFAAVEEAGRELAADEALLGRVDLAFDVPDASMPAALDREMLRRALGNIVRNAAQALRDARRAAPDGGAAERPGAAPWGKIRVSARVDGQGYLIAVDDDGPGIDPAVRDSVFDPYVTTRYDGTGLGLSIVKKIVVDHGGTIDVLESPLGGARFVIRLPRAGTPAARAALRDDGDGGPRGPAPAERERAAGSERAAAAEGAPPA
ncbi:histidine kinase [Sorangium cellulosum]|uniref:histidine kinase n=1 Tax=Sorangium cellulosum TaxID=56 RepID=A0A4P2Q9X8_SORCE|nr:ATP-binding protein [Sorangium cellulosum]AUX26071.1 histidine kinase [Sorangium cellulosum]